jgi:hypothetical protein
MELPEGALRAPERFAAEIVKIHRRTVRTGARVAVHYTYQAVDGAALCAWLGGGAEYVGGATLYALRDGDDYVVVGARSDADARSDALISAEERAFAGRIGARDREAVCAFIGACSFRVSRAYDLSDAAERARLLAAQG